MAISLAELYEQDFYLWTRAQAKALRRLAEMRLNADVDWPRLIEEVERLGKSERDAGTWLGQLYREARSDAERRLRVHGEPDAAAQLPERCPYTLAQILDQDWFPESRHGLPSIP